MALRFVDRLTTLIKADAHGVIESLEDRSLLLKQAVREAELSLNQKRARLETLVEEEARLQDEVKRLEKETQNLDRDIQMALEGGQEELARFSIRKLIPLRGNLSTTVAQHAEVTQEQAKLKERLESQEAEFESLRTRVRAHLARPIPTSLGEGLLATPLVADEEVELELLRRKQAGVKGTQ